MTDPSVQMLPGRTLALLLWHVPSQGVFSPSLFTHHPHAILPSTFLFQPRILFYSEFHPSRTVDSLTLILHGIAESPYLRTNPPSLPPLVLPS